MSSILSLFRHLLLGPTHRERESASFLSSYMEMEAEEEDPFSFPLNPDSISDLLSADSDRILSTDLRSNSSLRHDVVSIIFQLSSVIADPDPLAVYLAVGYGDRFLSARREALTERVWMALLAIACLSLAFKMKKIDLSPAGVQIREGIAFDGVTIRRMEVLILEALDWRMRSLTPFSFFRFFLFFLPLGDAAARTSVRSRASEIVLNSLRERSKVTKFKASVLAASALLWAVRETWPTHSGPFGEAISACSYLNGEELRECCDATGTLCSEVTTFSSRPPDTAMGVLLDHCPNSESRTTDGVVVVELSTN